MTPRRNAAAFYTTTAGLAATEMLYSGLYLPFPLLTAITGAAACLLSTLAATEWTTARTLHRPQEQP